MKYKLVIFDLDGTVLDTLGDLAGAVNAALKMHGFPTHTIEDVRRFIGNGVANLIRRAVPPQTDDAKCAQVLADFKDYYREHVNDLTQPYEGICDMLKRLRAAGIKIGINSNKFDAALQNLCRIHFEGLYDYAVGESEVTPKKPDPTAARRIMEALDCAPEDTIYIGDSDVDLHTAQNAGIAGAWVAWGFRKRAEMADELPLSFERVQELSEYLLS